MTYQPWELCDDIFTIWSEANEITLPVKEKKRAVVAKYLLSAWAYYSSSLVVDYTSTIRTLHTQHDTMWTINPCPHQHQVAKKKSVATWNPMTHTSSDLLT